MAFISQYLAQKTYSAGNNDITDSGFGTVKAFIGHSHREDVVESIEASIRNSLFLSDCVDGSDYTFIVRDNQTTANTVKRMASSSDILWFQAPLGAPGTNYAAFSGTITDGIQVTASVALADYANFLFMGGDDLTSKLITQDVSAATTYNVTGVGFQPDLIICRFLDSRTDFAGTSASFSEIISSLGIITNDGGSVQQNALLLTYDDNVSAPAGVNISRIETDSGGGAISTAGTLSYTIDFSDFDSDGFSVTPSSAPSGTTRLYCLCLNFNGKHKALSKIIDTPTSTGNQAFTGYGFQPKTIIGHGTSMPATDTTYTNSSTNGWSEFFIDDDGDEHTEAYYSEDGATTTQTEHQGKLSVASYNTTGSLSCEATYVSYDSDGFTLNFSSVEASAQKWLTVAISEEIGGNPWWYYNIIDKHYYSH